MTERLDDLLYSQVALPHRTELPVLGVPVRFASNSPAVVQEVQSHFGVWRRLPPELVGQEGVDVRVIVHDATEGPERPIPTRYRAPDADRFIVHTPGSLAILDARRREWTGYVSTELLREPGSFRHRVLNGLTLRLVNACDRHPVHAAVVARGSAAVVLAGPPGVGKSTLAYQAHLSGLRVLSDDSAFVQLRPTFRVWGLPGRLHLVAKGRRHFPEVGGEPGGAHGGHDKIAVEVASDWPDDGPPVATRVGVCRLDRTGGAAELTRASRDELVTFLDEGLGAHAAFHRGSMEAALSRLCANGGWRLALSDDPTEALPYIERMLAEIETQA